jgi:Yip1 domain
VIGYVSTAVIMPRMDWNGMANDQIEQMKARNPNMSQEQLDRVAKMGPAFGKVLGWIGPIFGAIWYLLVAAALLLAFRLAGGEGTFGQAFSATLYAWIPLVINGIVLTIIVFTRGSINPVRMATMVKSNPAFLVDMKTQPLLFALLSSIDIFTIWTIVLLIIGFAALSRSSKAKSAAIVISLWVVCILLKLIGPAIQSLRK